VRGEGWGEGDSPRTRTRGGSLTRTAVAIRPLPASGEVNQSYLRRFIWTRNAPTRTLNGLLLRPVPDRACQRGRRSFLVASGLSIIFGVTRIVNFAHGAFYMLGAYVAFTLTERFSGAIGFWAAS